MTTSAIDKMIATYKRQAAQREQEYLDSHQAWRNRQHMFASTQPGDRGAVSPLGGVAQPAAQPQPKAQVPKSDRWW